MNYNIYVRIISIGITCLLFLCSCQTITAQVPEKATEETPPPPPPPPPPEPSVEEIFTVVEQMPTFYGCTDSLSNSEKKQCAEDKVLEYIYANLAYPEVARENGVEGTVVVRFYVDKDGGLKDVTLLKDIGAGCGQEAVRLIKSMSKTVQRKWSPGKARANPVKVYFNLPIKFELEKSKK